MMRYRITVCCRRRGDVGGRWCSSGCLCGSCQAQAKKLDEPEEMSTGTKHHETVNDRAMSTTDPDAALVRRDGESRPRYKHHRVVDDAKGVITAMETTPGSVKENGPLMGLVE